MSSRRERGFTLVEMIIAIVIISVGLAGVMIAFSTVVRSSADPLIHKQMLAIAEEMMEEILLKPYLGSGTITGCNRASAQGIADYAAYSQPVCTIDGNVISSLTGYTVKVAMNQAATLGTLATDVTKVTVTVAYSSGDTISLVGWRTDYAK